jgi:hypothetical protein
MKLIGVSMVSNEADMVEAFVRHNLGVLDALVVLDHMSIDRTPDILRALAQEGLALAVLRDNERAFRQGERQTLLARRYLAEWQADFCFALDADELIACESRADLERALAALPADSHGLVPLRNYFGVGDATQANPVARLTRRMRVERKPTRKVVLRREFADDPANQVSFGNHAAIRVDAGRVTPLVHNPLEGVALAHFPVRSPEQIAKKALLGWLSWRLTQPERHAARALHARPPRRHCAERALAADVRAAGGGRRPGRPRDHARCDRRLCGRRESRAGGRCRAGRGAARLRLRAALHAATPGYAARVAGAVGGPARGGGERYVAWKRSTRGGQARVNGSPESVRLGL